MVNILSTIIINLMSLLFGYSGIRLAMESGRTNLIYIFIILIVGVLGLSVFKIYDEKEVGK